MKGEERWAYCMRLEEEANRHLKADEGKACILKYKQALSYLGPRPSPYAPRKADEGGRGLIGRRVAGAALRLSCTQCTPARGVGR